ncbi:MAG: hypothetical protein ABW133_18940 [Polyangiaceae bacterium]
MIAVSRIASAQAEPAVPPDPPATPAATLPAAAEPSPTGSTTPAPAPSTPPPKPTPEPESTTTHGVPAPDTADTATPRAIALEQKRPPRRFAGTQLFQQLSTTTATVVPNQQQTHNPTVEAATFLLPRYTFGDWQLRGRIVFSYELTSSDTTTTRNEPRFSDTTLQLFYRGLPRLAGIQALVGAQIIAPTSPEARARTMIASPGLVTQLSRPIEHVWGGELLLLGSLTYQHPLYRYTTPELRGDWPYRFACHGGGTGCDGQLGGVTNASDIVSWSFLVSGEWGKWSPALFVLGAHQFAYAPRSASGLDDPTSSGVRQTTYFSAWLDYNANAWFTAEVGYFMFRDVLSGDGTYGNPFFDKYQDARLYLGFNLNVDNLIKELIENDKDQEGGIIRAKNRFAPRSGTF